MLYKKCRKYFVVFCDVIYYVIAVHAHRMVHIFFLPYLGNCSKSDPCSYELLCLESHILSFPEVSQIPPESPCMYYRENYLTLDWDLRSWQLHWSLCSNNACCMASSLLMKIVLCIIFHIVCRMTHVLQSSVGSIDILMDSLWKDSCTLRPFLKLQHGARGKRNYRM